MFSREKVHKTKWEKVMTPFLKKTTLFRNFAHKMQSGGIFFRTNGIGSFCVAIVSPLDVIGWCVFVFRKIFIFSTFFRPRILTHLTRFS